jgi:hypothetical protein
MLLQYKQKELENNYGKIRMSQEVTAAALLTYFIPPSPGPPKYLDYYFAR